MKVTRVLLADDHRLIRSGLRLTSFMFPAAKSIYTSLTEWVAPS